MKGANMAADLQVFTNPAFGQIRTATIDGVIMFAGKDVACALGYENPNKAVHMHCRQNGGPKRHPLIDNLCHTQEATFITKGDVYWLIVSSRLPAAQQFEAWVFDEVLPQSVATACIR